MVHTDPTARFVPASDLRICLSRTAAPAVRVTVHGAVDLTTAAQLRDALTVAITNCEGDLVVDLTQLTFGGAECVTALVEAGASLQQHRRELVVVNPPPFFRRVLAACQLEDLAD